VALELADRPKRAQQCRLDDVLGIFVVPDKSPRDRQHPSSIDPDEGLECPFVARSHPGKQLLVFACSAGIGSDRI
jgi:hypothetical protein